MATVTGTTRKCKACEKTVYWVEQLAADNVVYHKTCFRCHHCKGTLKWQLSNYSSFDRVLYCKPHLDQLFKLTRSLEKSFEGTTKTVNKSVDQVANSRVSRSSLEPKRSVWPEKRPSIQSKRLPSMELHIISRASDVAAEGPSNYVTHEHRLYCKHHHNQLFKVKENLVSSIRTQR